MSTLPGTAESRVEEYLRNIITGSGSLPDQALSRIEEYLEYMAENGIPVPIASASSVGGIKVGSGLSIASDGTLSLSLSDADTEEF